MVSAAPEVIGKSVEKVVPATYATPEGSMAIAFPASSYFTLPVVPVPPRRVEKTSCPAGDCAKGFSTLKNTADGPNGVLPQWGQLVSIASGVTGKLPANACPTIYARPDPSTATEFPRVAAVPPNKVEYTRELTPLCDGSMIARNVLSQAGLCWQEL